MSPNYKFAKVRIYLTTLSQAQNSPNILHSLSSSSPERLGAKTHPWPSYRPHAILSCQSSLEPLAMLAARCDWAQIELSCIHPCKRPPTWPLSGNNLFWAAAWTTSQRTCHSWEPCIAHSSSVQGHKLFLVNAWISPYGQTVPFFNLSALLGILSLDNATYTDACLSASFHLAVQEYSSLIYTAWNQKYRYQDARTEHYGRVLDDIYSVTGTAPN